jgi:hypothetical protein
VEIVHRADDLFAENFDDFVWELRETRGVQEEVLALAEMTGRIKDSGTPIRKPIGIVASNFRGAMIGKVRFFITWQQALEAVGLKG